MVTRQDSAGLDRCDKEARAHCRQSYRLTSALQSIPSKHRGAHASLRIFPTAPLIRPMPAPLWAALRRYSLLVLAKGVTTHERARWPR